MAAAGFNSCILFFHALLVLQCFCGSISTEARKINAGEPPCSLKNSNNHDHQMMMSSTSSSDHTYDLAVKVFFTDKQLKLGNKIPIYFPVVKPSARPPLLSREEADSIPFSSSKLPYLLQLFSFPQDSRQAKAMTDTLSHCEFKSVSSSTGGETKFCATSLESMIDSAREVIGSGVPLKVVTTKHLTEQTCSILQNYTIQEEPHVISATRMVACHVPPYPFAVFYCHTKKDMSNKLLKVSLVGQDGGRVDAAVVCHMDTSDWDPNHVAFRVLKTVPGGSPICHFLPENNLVWLN